MRQRMIIRISADPPNDGEAGEVEMVNAYERATQWLQREYPEWNFGFYVLLGVADDNYDEERIMARSPAGSWTATRPGEGGESWQILIGNVVSLIVARVHL